MDISHYFGAGDIGHRMVVLSSYTQPQTQRDTGNFARHTTQTTNKTLVADFARTSLEEKVYWNEFYKPRCIFAFANIAPLHLSWLAAANLSAVVVILMALGVRLLLILVLVLEPCRVANSSAGRQFGRGVSCRCFR